MTEQNGAKNTKPKVNVRFVFNHCNDVQKMRDFYGNLLGLEEAAFNEEWGYLCFRSEGFEFMFFRSREPLEVPAGFSSQPGYKGGDRKAVSWAIEVPEEAFAPTVMRLREAGVTSWQEDPEWRQDSYWGYSILDPMGVTVEVYSIPAEKPENTIWPES